SRTVDLSSTAPSSAAGTDAGFSRPNPVCTEIGVSVQGSSHAAANGQTSQPFLEQTTTVIVFAQGAVVRLSESVTPGQILILRHLRTNEESACRVVSVKSNPNVKGYVELEFLQPTPAFWGMDFPSSSSAKVPSAAAPHAAAPSASQPAIPASPARSERDGSDPWKTQPIPRLGSPAPAVRSSVPAVDTSNTAANAGMTFLPDLLDSLTLPTETKQRAPETAPRVEQPRTAPARPERDAAQPSAPAPAKPSSTPWATPPAAPRSDVTKGTPAPGDGAYISDLLDTLTPIGETILRDKAKAAASQPQAAPPAPASSRPPVVAHTPMKATAVSYVEPEIAESSLPSLAAEPAHVTTRATASHTASSVSREVTPRVSSEVAPLLSDSDAVSRGHLLASEPAIAQSSKGLPKPMRILAVAAAILLALAAGDGIYRWGKKSATPAATVAVLSQPAAGAPGSISGTAPTAASPASGVAPTGTAAAGAEATTTAKNSHSSAQPNTNAQPTAAASSTSAKSPAATASAPRSPAVANMKISAPTAASRSTNQATPTIGGDVPNAVQNASAAGLLGESAPSGPAAPAPALRTSSGVEQPRLLSAPAPIYPYAARAEHVQGDVSVDLVIDSNGKVATMTVLSGPALLRPAALDALRQRKYSPAMLDGKPTVSHIVVVIHFQI
ncbi:MAG: energy transducer TonB, partial [Candidatus Acidiferrales bacterium]